MRAVLRSAAVVAGLAALAVLAAACSGDDDAGGGDGRPTVVATTTILGDIVGAVVGDLAAVEVVMPAGADPHEFAASARQAEAMADADLLVVHGAGFEHDLADVVEAAEDGGATVFALADHVDLLDGDPHVWTDPRRVAGAVEALGEALAEAGIDVGDGAARYAEELLAVDAEVEAMLAEVPEERRVLVTNHEVLAYFADRYGFEVVGTVIPGGGTGAQPSTSAVEALADLVAEAGVPAVFAETTTSADLARALADAAGSDVEVVTLHTESLGEEGSGAETYLGMLRTNAELVRGALA